MPGLLKLVTQTFILRPSYSDLCLELDMYSDSGRIQPPCSGLTWPLPGPCAIQCSLSTDTHCALPFHFWGAAREELQIVAFCVIIPLRLLWVRLGGRAPRAALMWGTYRGLPFCSRQQGHPLDLELHTCMCSCAYWGGFLLGGMPSW